MNVKQKFAEELQMKEERISEWENYGLLDRSFCELPKVEYWYLEE